MLNCYLEIYNKLFYSSNVRIFFFSVYCPQQMLFVIFLVMMLKIRIFCLYVHKYIYEELYYTF